MNEQRPVIIETVRQADGRSYPADLSEPEQRRARVLAHNLVCRDRLSYRDAQQALLAYGLRRSLGWLTKVIHGYDCGERCTGRPAEPVARAEAEPSQPAAAHVHPTGLAGGLTGMIERG